MTKETIPSHTTHPGTLIADELEYIGIRQKELAEAMRIAPNVLSEIIHGKRNLTVDLAFKLESALDIDAAYWMRLQVRYEIDTIRIKNRKAITQRRRKEILDLRGKVSWDSKLKNRVSRKIGTGSAGSK